MGADRQLVAEQQAVTSQRAVFAGLDRAEYQQLTRELTGYCYRMLGSPFDAEDAVQEAMTRAWRELERFEGRSSLRTWLYRIATNVCIDMLHSRSRRTVPMDFQPPSPPDGSQLGAPMTERNWVLPIPDARIQADGMDPAQLVIWRETVRLAFIAALQRLTPRQRAVLILRDVLVFTAAESADMLGTTVASANSALQRARTAMPVADSVSGAVDAGAAWPAGDRAAGPDPLLIDEYVAAFESFDVPRLTALLCRDAVISMPPRGMWLRGADDIGRWMLGPGSACRGSRLLPTGANGCAALAQYRSDDQAGRSPWAIQVVETSGDRISALHCYVLPELFEFFGFPLAL